MLSELADGSFKELGLKLRTKRAHSLEMLEKYSESLLEYERIMQVDTRFKNAQEGYNRVRRMLIETGKLGGFQTRTLNRITPELYSRVLI